jgi:hypothetical protein
MKGGLYDFAPVGARRNGSFTVTPGLDGLSWAEFWCGIVGPQDHELPHPS